MHENVHKHCGPLARLSFREARFFLRQKTLDVTLLRHVAVAENSDLMHSMIIQRPRLRNWLHALRLIEPYSGTIERELDALARHAAGKRIALEIGTDEGVSAVRIAHAMGGACCTV